MMRPLAMPDRAVSRVLDRSNGELRVASPYFLEAGDVGLSLSQPFEQAWQSAVDPVDVECRDANRAFRCHARQSRPPPYRISGSAAISSSA